MKATSHENGLMAGMAGFSSIIALLKNTMAAKTGSALMMSFGRVTRLTMSEPSALMGLSGFSTSTK